MDFFKNTMKKIERLAANDDVSDINVQKQTSDKAVEIIKELSGVNKESKKKVIDNVIVFSNSSGGAGTSTLVTNVAYTALKKKLKVLIIDLNIMYPSQHLYIGVRQELEKPDLVSYLLGKTSISESIDNSCEINMLYANNRTLNDEINCNSKIAIENLTQLIDRVRQYYDIIFVDCPMRVDTMLSNTMFYLGDAIYLVMDEGVSSTINTEKIRRNMALSGIDSFTKMRAIVNKRTDVTFSNFAFKKLNIELMEVLPFSADIIENSMRGNIFCENGTSTNKNSSEFARKIESLTDKILKIAGYIE